MHYSPLVPFFHTLTISPSLLSLFLLHILVVFLTLSFLLVFHLLLLLWFLLPSYFVFLNKLPIFLLFICLVQLFPTLLLIHLYFAAVIHVGGKEL